MPDTRKKVIKTVYKDDSEDETGDFSDSDSEAQISEPPSSDQEEIEETRSSADEFDSKIKPKEKKKNRQKQPVKRKPLFVKDLIGKINKQTLADNEDNDIPLSQFSVKDLTDADKLLPSVLNLSESDSSDDETPKTSVRKTPAIPYPIPEENESDNEDKANYTDVWANIHDNSAEVAKKTFMELEKHKTSLEETKASIQSYVPRSSMEQEKESNVTDLLALGEDVVPTKSSTKKKRRTKQKKDDSESELEDWEEVKESKAIPQQGLQLVVALPDSVCHKSKKVDLEMMMKRKINRVKKEHQVFMHKVHVLCWIGHGNFVSHILNDQEIMATVLAMVPKGCYPEDRLNMKYVEQITTWFKDKIILKHDKNENKFRPKAPPLKSTLLEQIKRKTVTAKKYSVFIFVAMLRALGLQCRIMFNFVTVPLRPPISELCSLATKTKDDKSNKNDKKEEKSKPAKSTSKTSKAKTTTKVKLPQVDGIDDSFSTSDSEFENIMQLDGNDDVLTTKTRTLRSARAKKTQPTTADIVKEDESVSPPKRSKKEAQSQSKAFQKTKNVQKPEPSKSPQRKTAMKDKGDNSTNELNNKQNENLEKATQKTKTVQKPEPSKSPQRKTAMKDKGDNSKNELNNKQNENLEKATQKTKTVQKPKPSKSPQRRTAQKDKDDNSTNELNTKQNENLEKLKTPKSLSLKKVANDNKSDIPEKDPPEKASLRKTRSNIKTSTSQVSKTLLNENNKKSTTVKKLSLVNITVTDENLEKSTESKSFNDFKTGKEENKGITKQSTVNKITTLESQSIKKSNLVKAIETAEHLETNLQSKYFEGLGTSKEENKDRSANRPTKTATFESKSKSKLNPPKITITDEDQVNSSKYFESLGTSTEQNNRRSTRKRSHTTVVNGTQKEKLKDAKPKTRTKSAPGSAAEKSKYFCEPERESKKPKLSVQQLKKQNKIEDMQRVSHKDLTKSKSNPRNDVTGDLVNIIKGRIKDAKEEAKKGIVKGKVKKEDSDDSDYLPVEDSKHRNSDSDEDFKPTKISPRAPKLSPGSRPSTSKKQVDRRVLSSDDEAMKSKKVDVWCEVFVEELEQWIAVDVINGKVHCTGDLYSHATHPALYVIGWDNNNYLKDLTRRYVPHWNTVTRKQRAEPEWWGCAVQPWLGPSTARDREEDVALDIQQLEAPLPKSIGEYKNHPLYALKRHLLKFDALYPPNAAILGFVRNEPVYARDCVYTCRSRDVWLKEAKTVKMGETPYKIVKARPKWDRLSNKCIKDKPLEVFGPWQVQDYEPPTAEGGIVPRNAYGNVELFKECMLPKGTVHIKLPGLNKVARKLNIDCAPAMTGFDYSGGYAHPAYDGFVVCKEFEEIITKAWVVDQEEQERKEMEKMENRVYGNWRRLIKGLLIRERLKLKYGFEKPNTSQPAKSKKGPRLVVKKN